MTLPIGFHSGVPSKLDGIGNLFNQLAHNGQPIAAKSVSGTGSLFDAEQHDNAIGIWRMDVGFPGQHDDVPRYGHQPIGEEADRFWEAAKAQFATTGLNKNKTWIELLNEMNKDDDGVVDWIGYLCYELAYRAVRDGYKLVLAGWSAGTPEPYHWDFPGQQKFLKYASENRAQVAISLHEYSYRTDQLVTNYNIGLFKKLNEACKDFDPPNIFITEFGWTLREIPPTTEIAVYQLEAAYRMYRQYPNVKCLLIWCLDINESHWGDIHQHVHKLMPHIPNIVDVGQIDLGGDPAMPEPENNLLVNGNFSDGWSDFPASHGGQHQRPLGWELEVTPIGQPSCFNQKTGQMATVSNEAENIHKLNDQLPPDEQIGGANALVLSGTAVYKIFGNGVWKTKLSQHLNNLDPNKQYRARLNFNVHYHSELNTDSPDDTQVHIEFGHSDLYLDTTDMHHKIWKTVEIRSKPDSNGFLELKVTACLVWENVRSIFIDDFSVEEMVVPDPDPIPPDDCPGQTREQFHRRYILLPPAVTTNDWLKAVADGMSDDNGNLLERYTMGFSADDAGLGDLVNRTIFAINPASWNGDLDEFYTTYYPGAEVLTINVDTPAELTAVLKYYVDKGELPPNNGGGFPA